MRIKFRNILYSLFCHGNNGYANAHQCSGIRNMPDLISQPVHYGLPFLLCFSKFPPSLGTATRRNQFHLSSPCHGCTYTDIVSVIPASITLWGCDYVISPMFLNLFLPCPGVDQTKPSYPTRHGSTSCPHNLIRYSSFRRTYHRSYRPLHIPPTTC